MIQKVFTFNPLTKNQIRNAWLVILLGFLYFILLAFVNVRNAADEHMLFILSQDENIQYPYVLDMLAPDDSLIATIIGFVNYGHYFYGFPFYLLSALVLLPMRLIFGDGMTAYTQINLLLLRQFVNVLPMTIAIIMLVYLQTRFKSRWRSILLFLFLAAVPGIFRTNINWWHPDNLAALFTILTIFFLDRDRLGFGNHFYLAAFFCGLTVGTKVYGFFFFTAVGGYLFYGLYSRKLDLKKTILSGFLFIVVMAATIVLSNPMLMYKPSRERILEIQSKQNYDVTHGWGKEEEKSEYEKGLRAWLPYLEKWYGKAYFLAFALISIIAGCIWGEQVNVNRLILLWITAYAIYLLIMVAIKNDHYWLPVMLPWFSAAFVLIKRQPPSWWIQPGSSGITVKKRVWQVFIAAAILLLVIQFISNIATDAVLFNTAIFQEYLLRHNINP